MRLLVDTHALLWFAADDKRLSRRAAQAMEDDAAELYLSTVTIWELAIKVSLGRLTLPSAVEQYVADKLDEGFRVLDVSWRHAARTERLPWHHRDPFDRLLAAQSIAEDVPVVTKDRVFRKYGVNTVW